MLYITLYNYIIYYIIMYSYSSLFNYCIWHELLASNAILAEKLDFLSLDGPLLTFRLEEDHPNHFFV